MKKSLLLTLFIVSLVFFSACNNKKIDESTINVLNNEEEVIENNFEILNENEVKEIQLTANIPCVVFYDSAEVWIQNENGKLDSIDKLYCGSELLAFPSDSNKIGEECETKEFAINGQTEINKYTKIFFNNKICWINSNVISPYSISGLIIDSLSVLYKNPSVEESEEENEIIPQYQMIAINTNFVSPSTSEEVFAKITFRSEDKSYINYYVKNSSISKFDDDVKAMILLNKAAISEDRQIKEDLLKICNELFVSEEMKTKIEEDTENILYQYIPEE